MEHALWPDSEDWQLHQAALFNDSEYIEVFLVSGSAEERHLYVGDIIGQQQPRMILCSMQYLSDVTQTIDYFLQHRYSLYMHWLNPGYSDTARQQDALGLIPILLDRGAVVAIRDATNNASVRVEEMKDFLYGWAKSRNLFLT